MYKIKHGLSANCFNNIFVNKDDDMYNLRSGCDFRVPSVNTENCGKNSLRYFGPVIWNMIPLSVRNIKTLAVFKKEICKWKLDNCPCGLYKNFIGRVSFI